MSEVSCPGCAQRDAVIEALRRRVDELERQVKDLQTAAGGQRLQLVAAALGQPARRPARGGQEAHRRKTGGQPGHKGHQRLRLPPQRVQHVIALVPTHCEDCHAPLPVQPSAGRPRAGLAPVRRTAQGPGRGHRVPGPRPHLRPAAATSPARPSPPRSAPTPSARAWPPCSATSRAATTSATAAWRRSAEVVFGVPLSLGSVTALQEQTERSPAAGPRGDRRARCARPRPRTWTRRAGSRPARSAGCGRR